MKIKFENSIRRLSLDIKIAWINPCRPVYWYIGMSHHVCNSLMGCVENVKGLNFKERWDDKSSIHDYYIFIGG